MSETFNIWFPALVGGLIVGLLAAAFWDLGRRRFWLIASKFWPGVLNEVTGIGNPAYLSLAKAEEYHREISKTLSGFASQINFLVSDNSPMAESANSPATEISRSSNSSVSSNSGATSVFDIEAQGEINLEMHSSPIAITVTASFPDGTSNDAIRPAKRLFKRYAHGQVKRIKSSIILQATLLIDPDVLAEIGELAKKCMSVEKRCTFQLGNWATIYYNAGKVHLHMLKEADVPVNVEARWQDERTSITMRGLYLTGALIKAGTQQTSIILRSTGPATQGLGDLDELDVTTKGQDAPGEDSLIYASKLVEADGVSLIVRSDARFVLPPLGKFPLLDAVWAQWQRIWHSAKSVLTSLLLKAEECHPENTANLPELEFDHKQLERTVDHWKGLSEIELLNMREGVLHYLQELRASGDVERAGPQPPHSQLNCIRDEYDLEYWRKGLQDLNEVIHRNTSDPPSGAHISIRGGIKFLLGDFESALQDFDLAYLNRGGDLYTVMLERGLVKCMLGRYSEAIQDFVAVIKIKPNGDDIQELQTCIQQILDQQAPIRRVESAPSIQRSPDEDSSMVNIPDSLTRDERHNSNSVSPAILEKVSGKWNVVTARQHHHHAASRERHKMKNSTVIRTLFTMCRGGSPADSKTTHGRRHSGTSQITSGAAASKSEFPTSRRVSGAGSAVHSNMSHPLFSNLNWVADAASSDTSSVSHNPLKRRIDWIIGLDFGTTFSGFAYARASGDTQIKVHYNWPRKGNENPYCKTLTGLYYRKEEEGNRWECSSWGYPARSDYMENRKHVDPASTGIYLTKFKLLLMRGLNDPALAASIPKPLTPMSVITDYLRLIGEHALDEVRKHHLGDLKFSKDLVQWVVTVPSIWDENAKQQMKVCMVDSGLVGLGGIDAVNVVLEPEAASFHCHEILRRDRKEFSLDTNDKILVADVGGGTVDIVVQEMIGNSQTFRVQELTESSGELCGGTFVDASFMKFLSQKIPCLDAYLNEHPTYKTRLLKDCEEIKCAFGHELMFDTDSKDITLPNDLAALWQAYESSRGHALKNPSVVELTHQDLTSIFAPVVAKILSLIAAQLAQVSNIKVMFVVGGFADSRYLRQCILERFEGAVTHIVSPPNPGSAIVQGAVSLGLHPEAIASRIARRTYGTSFTLPFERGRDPRHLSRVTSGGEYCYNRFDVFVRKGDRIKVDKSLTKTYVPLTKDQKEMVFDIWSSSDKEPRYTVEGEGTTKEGSFSVSLPGDELPRFDMTMSFGRGHIEVRAVGNVPGREERTLVLPVKYCS